MACCYYSNETLGENSMENRDKQRILIIEDEKNLARFIELELKHEGYETEICYNGRTRTGMSSYWI